MIPCLCVVSKYGKTKGAATSFAVLPRVLGYGRFMGSSRVTGKLSPFGSSDVTMTIRTDHVVCGHVGRLVTSNRAFTVRAALTAHSNTGLVQRTRERKCCIALLCF